MTRYIVSCRGCTHMWMWHANRIEIKQRCPHCKNQWWTAVRA